VKADDFLNKLLEKIKVTQEEIEKAIKRKTLIKEELEKLGNLAVKDTGSFSRGTAICPIHDLDLFVVIEKGKFPNNITSLKEFFQRKIQSIVDKNCETLIGAVKGIPVLIVNHGLLIKYPRNKSQFLVDIVLAYPHESKNDWFKIPDIDEITNQNKWIETNKQDHEFEFDKAKKNSEGTIINYIKIFKYWSLINRKGKKAFNSYFLEQLILEKLPSNSNQSKSLSKNVILLFDELSNGVIDEKYQKPPYYIGNISEMELKRRNRAREFLLRDLILCNENNWSEVFNKKIKY